jgi:hypothetical protein
MALEVLYCIAGVFGRFFVDVRREILEWDIQHCEHFTRGF